MEKFTEEDKQAAHASQMIADFADGLDVLECLRIVMSGEGSDALRTKINEMDANYSGGPPATETGALCVVQQICSMLLMEGVDESHLRTMLMYGLDSTLDLIKSVDSASDPVKN